MVVMIVIGFEDPLGAPQRRFSCQFGRQQAEPAVHKYLIDGQVSYGSFLLELVRAYHRNESGEKLFVCVPVMSGVPVPL